MPEAEKRQTVRVVRWTARLLGTAMLLMMVAFAIGEGLPNPLSQPPTVMLELLAMLAMWLGLLAALKWEGIGAALVLCGYACFCAVEWQAPNVHFPWGLFLLAGLLYLFCWWSTRRAQRGA